MLFKVLGGKIIARMIIFRLRIATIPTYPTTNREYWVIDSTNLL